MSFHQVWLHSQHGRKDGLFPYISGQESTQINFGYFSPCLIYCGSDIAIFCNLLETSLPNFSLTSMSVSSTLPRFNSISICNLTPTTSVSSHFHSIFTNTFSQPLAYFFDFNFGHFSAKYQGYSLTFWPKIADLDHFSICNQNQSISILVIFRQNTKVIALLFAQTSLIWITFQSAIKINQFQFWSFFGKIPRL